MRDGGRIAGGVVLLIALWIGVYWWWPSEPKVTIAQADDAVRGVSPKHKAEPQPAPPAAPQPAPEPKPAPAPKAVPDAHPQPEPPQAMIPPEFIQYTVKQGDTFASIAKSYYGSEALASVIIAANPLMSPQNLKIGRVIQVPKDPNNIQGIPVKQAPKATEPAPPASSPADRIYVVQAGDSLSKIAKEVYGDLRLSTLIFEANRDQLATEDAIKPGQHLKIPPRPQR
jgi:nucleoid-associated protein YgaU